MPWKPSHPGEWPTLGWYALEWISENLARPDCTDYEPLMLTAEQAQFVLRYYRLDPLTGRRKYRRAVWSRPKGHGKSPLAAAMCCLEALADIVPDGWDAKGQPVGRPWASLRTPLVQLAAVSEDQTANAYVPLLEMLREGPAVDNYAIEPMETFVALPKGRIEPITSAARSREGNRPIFAVLDQALAIDTPIPTPLGWTTMGQLQSGDYVYGSDGNPVAITEAKPVSTEHDCYRVTFTDGTSVVASAGHLWMSRRSGWPRGYNTVRTTEQMNDGYRYRVPVSKPLERPAAKLSAHPYLVGLWLGDGTRGKCEIAVGVEDVDDTREILRNIGVETWQRIYARNDGATAAISLTFSRGHGYQSADRPEAAKAIANLPCYFDKHIPADYLNGSVEQRTQLLRGLMDADGCVTEAGTCTFVNTNKRLAYGVVELLRSLGQVCSGAKWVDDSRYTEGGKYRVDFTPRGGLIPVALPRKAARVRQHNRGADWVTIRSIERVPRVPVRCIAVSSDDHLFAAGEGCHLTHNTESWVQSNGGIHLAAVLRRNIGKVGGSSLEVPNAFLPGEGSVAEKSASYAEQISEGRTRDDGLLYDHREAPADTDLFDRDSLLAGLRIAYGDSALDAGGWVDLDRIVAEIFDPATDPQDARRFYLNQVTKAADSWVDSQEWRACYDETKVVADKDVIVLGFDGSRGRSRGNADATALIGCRVADGHLFEIGQRSVWESTRFDPRDWQPPVAEVDSLVRWAFQHYTVVGFYADPTFWSEHVAKWEAKFRGQLKVKASSDPISYWSRGKNSTAVTAVQQLHAAITNGECTHDGSAALTRHILNARKRNTRTGYLLYKAYPDSPDKIDAAYAAVLAWQARLDAVSAGIGKRKRRTVARLR